MENKFYIKKIKDAEDLPLPKYMTSQAAGMDLYANVFEETIIKKGEIKLISVGISISLPENFEASLRPRSGLALNNGITLINSPATIDADYRGEIKVALINFGDKDFAVNRADRIAQMIINKIERVNFVEVSELSETERGKGGYGHTGIN